jgi:hypothetical protein
MAGATGIEPPLREKLAGLRSIGTNEGYSPRFVESIARKSRFFTFWGLSVLDGGGSVLGGGRVAASPRIPAGLVRVAQGQLSRCRYLRKTSGYTAIALFVKGLL